MTDESPPTDNPYQAPEADVPEDDAPFDFRRDGLGFCLRRWLLILGALNAVVGTVTAGGLLMLNGAVVEIGGTTLAQGRRDRQRSRRVSGKTALRSSSGRCW